MLTKFETKSNRVKGISFHPSRPWILASLHNGVIQLWDYRIRTLIDKFDEHDGPVRGVNFHPTQPLFVSGGDDYKIKVWNYKQRRCLFTLLGHLDYIRTVEFHRESPWILSASDDQTIRIWNWQSRTCVAVLTGHNHYVMCAQFHPKEDLIVSASLDQTVRVWDISGLRRRVAVKQYPESEGQRLQNELFGNTDAVVKYVLEGHDRGVNWAAFHPTSPLIVSGADDRQVKLWRMNDTKAWEVDTFRGHFNNVSCAIFHPRQELLISNGEDKTIRVWDIAKRTGLQTFRREHDRFWILAAHPDLNLFAAGHDSGLIVFKLERERPAFVTHNNEMVFYIKDKYIRTYDLSNGRDVPVLSVRRAGSSSYNQRTQILHYSPQDRVLLVTSEAEGGTFEMYQLPKDGRGADNVEPRKGSGSSALFVARDRYAYIEKGGQIVVRSISKNEETKRVIPPHPTDAMWPAPAGLLLLRGEERVTLYDIQQKKALAELAVPFVKYVVWSPNQQQVALVGRDTLVLANRQLEQLCSVHETIRIKGGAWDEAGAFIYATLNHLKYALPGGDTGTIRTVESALYITAARGNRVYGLDREGKTRTLLIDPTEHLFKLALHQQRYHDVLRMVRENALGGQAIISYLQKKGFPEVALYFVRDDRTRFTLALECGNIEVALEAATVLDDSACWQKLGVEALRQGNHVIVERAYQRTKSFERLSFLYLITGNVTNLRKMLKIAEMRQDTMARFHNALFLGDLDERLSILSEVGLTSLAYVAAATHGLGEKADALAEKLQAAAKDGEEVELPSVLPGARLLAPPTPIITPDPKKLHESNWPLLTVSKGVFATLADEGSSDVAAHKFASAPATDVSADNVNAWGGDLDLDESGNAPASAGAAGDWDTEDTIEDGEGAAPSAAGEGDGWGLGEELEGLDQVDTRPAKGGEHFWVPPQPGPNTSAIWTRNSQLPADHVAAASFESAMQLLHQQIGAVNFAPLKPLFLSLYMASRVTLSGIPGAPPLFYPLQRNASEFESGVKGGKGRSTGLPLVALALAPLVERLKQAYKATSEGKFTEALVLFNTIMQTIPLVGAESKQEALEVKELLGFCREYVTGLRMEVARKELAGKADQGAASAKRQVELAAYFTHCNLQPPHLILSLWSAMKTAHKFKNYQTAASFGRRLLELNPNQEFATQAMKVVRFADTNSTNEHQLNYDERNPFVVCGISFVPIFRGSPLVRCPYCASAFLPEHSGKLCPTCNISQIGREAPGLQLFK